MIVSTWLGTAYAGEPGGGAPSGGGAKAGAASAPDAPPAAEPTAPAVGTPAEPGVGVPEAPAAGMPDAPAAGMPDAPPVGTPSEPAVGTPSEPAVGTPELPPTGAPDSPPAGPPPGEGAPPVSAALPRLSGFAQVRYDQLALRRDGEGFWIVVDGTGHRLDLEEWAARTGDRGPLQRAWRREAVEVGWLERVGGAVLFGAGIGGLLAIPPVDEAGTSKSDARRAGNQIGVVASGVTAAAGFGLLVVSFAEPTPAHRRHPDLSAWLTREAADTVIGAYNEQLRVDLAAVGP